MKVEVVCAWPQRCQRVTLELPPGACLSEAVRAAGMDRIEGVSAYAVFGTNAQPDSRLRDGDRVELLRPLLIDPKQSRRRRAQDSRKQGRGKQGRGKQEPGK
ncbi:RnfH family protein [Lysobacter sp. A421]